MATRGGGGGGGDGFIDRSKVRILLCDNDARSSEEVFTLLLNCSYQVTSARSPRQAIDALNAEGPDIDIILAEVDLPMKKGFKLLKYIARDKELERIPVIMMSAKDEVPIVVKCLRLGAADYLVKPLRTNELLNLWTHMWRRRHRLGLVEKHVLNYEIDLMVSDPSDANTNSTILFSDDTDDKSHRSTNMDLGMSTCQEDEATVAAAAAASTSVVEPSQGGLLECHPEVPLISDCQTGQLSAGPKKSELKIAESSAFFTYVRSSIVRSNSEGAERAKDKMGQIVRTEEMLRVPVHQIVDAQDNYSRREVLHEGTCIAGYVCLDRSGSPPGSREFRDSCSKNDCLPQVGNPGNECQVDGSNLSMQNFCSYYMHGVLNQACMPSSTQVYRNNMLDLWSHVDSTMLAQYNHLPHCTPQVTGMTSFPYYPVNLCLQTSQVSNNPLWPSLGSSPSIDGKLNTLDRREAALIKFRQKRKERCFDKKIRYVNRKKLAERRPRVRGQFVRKVNGVNMDLNGQPASTDCDEDEEEEEEEDDDEHVLRDSSPEDDAAGT